MPQVLKKEIRERILVAAREVFATEGFTTATMAAIAEQAGLGTASLYRYYPGKNELFEASIPQALVQEFEALLNRRVRALGVATSQEADAFGEEILRFWIAHRLEVVILLDRAEGTAYAHFGNQFVDTLLHLTLEQLQQTYAGVIAPAPTRFVLRRIFEHTRRMLASILVQHQDEQEIRQAIRAFWAYQIAGLRGFSEHWAGTSSAR